MSNYVIADQLLGNPSPVSAVDTVQRFDLGYEARGHDMGLSNSAGTAAATTTSANVGGAVFVYCQGSNVSSAGQFVQIQNGSAVALAAANSLSNFPIGVAAGALSGSGVYGWVQVQGRVDYAQHTNTGLTAGVQQYICAGTAGIVLSNVVAGNRIQGLCVPYNQTVTATSVSYVYDLWRPFVAGLTASL